MIHIYPPGDIDDPAELAALGPEAQAKAASRKKKRARKKMKAKLSNKPQDFQVIA